MTKPIKITVRGTNNRGNDAPTVQDLLSQIQDFVSVLHGVEDAVSDDGKSEIVWRITNATKNSPITFEITPYPKNHAMNIDRRAEKVIGFAAEGLRAITTSNERPMYFSDQVIGKAEKIYNRVTNGLAETLVDFSEYENAPELLVTKHTAKAGAENIAGIRKPPPIAHRELGSLEGHIAKVEIDGLHRPIVWLRSRLDGQMVKCVSGEGGLDRIGHYEVMEVLRGLRVRVHGLMNYKDLEQIANIEVDGVHVFEPDDELPDMRAIVSPDFTAGIEASAYLKALREDG